MPECVTVEYTIYSFDELSDEAKQRALNDFCAEDIYPWYKEHLDSLNGFCDLFYIKVRRWKCSQLHKNRLLQRFVSRIALQVV
jgi:inactivated superfamily I helicase